MRKVKRIAAPHSLRRPELLHWASEMTAFYARPADVRAGLRPPFERYNRLFLDEEVMQRLRDQFAGKCAYCEARVEPDQGLIENFRPVMSALDPRSGQESADHYAWLAYEWRNLMLACRECAAYKRNAFPLASPRARAMTAYRETVAIERPLLIDPCRDDPSRHLSFLPDGYLLARDDRGYASIEILALNRERLARQRKDAIEFALGTLENKIVGRYSTSAGFMEQLDTLAHSGAMRAAIDWVFAEALARAGAAFPGKLRSDRGLAALDGRGQDWIDAAAAYRDFQARVLAQARESTVWRTRVHPPAAYIESVRIRDFKAIDDLKLDFATRSSQSGATSGAMLLGENAAGKSTVLQALALALMDGPQRRAARADGAEFLPRERRSWDPSPQPPRVEVRLSNGETRRLGVDSMGRFVADFADDTDASIDSVARAGAGAAPMLLAYGARRFFRAHGKGAAGAVARSLFDPFAALQDPGAWLRDPDNPHFDPVARALREIFALHGDDRVFRAEDGHVLVQAHGRVTPVERMSDGYRALFAMAVDIMRRMVETWGNLEFAQGVVLVDEIDVHLHPRWKIEVIAALRRAMPKVQFIVSAHDALCLRGMRDGEVHVLYRDEDDRIRARANLPNIELMRTDQLLTSDYFGLPSTARPQTEAALNRYAYLLGVPEPTPGQARERERLALDLEALPRGDTPAEQLIGEATERYIRTRRSASPPQRGRLREQALEEIVRRLEQRLGKEIGE